VGVGEVSGEENDSEEEIQGDHLLSELSLPKRLSHGLLLRGQIGAS